MQASCLLLILQCSCRILQDLSSSCSSSKYFKLLSASRPTPFQSSSVLCQVFISTKYSNRGRPDLQGSIITETELDMAADGNHTKRKQTISGSVLLEVCLYISINVTQQSSRVVLAPPAAALEPLSSRLSIRSPEPTLPGNRSHKITCQRDPPRIAVSVGQFDGLSSLAHSLSAQDPYRRGKTLPAPLPHVRMLRSHHFSSASLKVKV